MPDVRSRSVVTEVTRNMTTNGKSASSAGPMRSKVPGCPSKTSSSSQRSTSGTTSSIAIVRGSRRSCVRTRRVVASVLAAFTAPPPLAGAPNEREERLLGVGRSRAGEERGASPAPGRPRRASARARRSASPRPSRGSRRGASCRLGEPMEEVPELRAEHGVEADRGLVEDDQLRSAEQGDRQRGARPLAAREAADDLVGVGLEPHLARRRASTSPAGAPRTAAKYRRFSRTLRSS